MNRRKLIRRTLNALLGVFVLLNVVAVFHAYKFTHFSKKPAPKIDVSHLATADKLKMAVFGVNNARPVNEKQPAHPYRTVTINSNVKLECWEVKHPRPMGTVIFFHGYIASKSTQLERAEEFYQLGYSLLLVDFMGSGGSEGYETTIGYREAAEVKDVYEYLAKAGEQNIYLFGTSMGAAAILKAMHDYPAMAPRGIILECPFGSMYKTVCARFKTMSAPAFPMAGLLVFWGGAINGFWAFGHNPQEYARSVKCPALLMCGGKDERVSREEIDCIYSNLQGEKFVKIYPGAGHESYLNDYREEWVKDISAFLPR